MKASEVLERAADLIEERGLAKDILEDERGRFCVIGALCHVRNGSAPLGVVGPAYGYMQIEINTQSLARWNNAPERTPTEVIDTLRFAAKRARNDELIADEAAS